MPQNSDIQSSQNVQNTHSSAVINNYPKPVIPKFCTVGLWGFMTGSLISSDDPSNPHFLFYYISKALKINLQQNLLKMFPHKKFYHVRN
jgi:hypothetical protein